MQPSLSIEIFQLTHSVGKAPEAAQIKRVIDLLREGRQALTVEQIYEGCYVNLMINKVIFDFLRRNPEVHYDGGEVFLQSDSTSSFSRCSCVIFSLAMTCILSIQWHTVIMPEKVIYHL